jgi:hypothetical protein
LWELLEWGIEETSVKYGIQTSIPKVGAFNHLPVTGVEVKYYLYVKRH